MAYEWKPAAIGLIDHQLLARCLSPELMLVDPELARWARDLLREPHETNGKGWDMSALGTHEITAGIGLGLEPPLSPPVVRGSDARMAMPESGLDLPTPPPAIRPPESAPTPAQAPAPAPAPELQPLSQPVPAQPEAPAPAQPEPVLPLTPPAAPAQVEADLPTMAPAEEPVVAPAPQHDYFAASAEEQAAPAEGQAAP